jgi:hypothetical protein
MAAISTWSTTAASNNSASPDGAPEGWAPSEVNAWARETMAAVRTQHEDAEWIDLGDTITYVSGTQFTINGKDVTTAYHVNRRIRMVGSTTGTIYGLISASSFSTNTTVTVVWDSGSMQSETLTGSLGLAGATNPSIDDQAISGIGDYAKTSAIVGFQTIWVPSTAISPTFSNGCAPLATVETTAGRPDIQALDFDPDTDEFGQFSVAFPDSWDKSTVIAQFHWTHAATATNFGVVWAAQGVAISNDDTIDVAYGTAQVIADTGGTAEDLYTTSGTPAITIAGTPADADLTYFRVYRDADHGSDTLAIDARLLGVAVFYTTDALNDD